MAKRTGYWRAKVTTGNNACRRAKATRNGEAAPARGIRAAGMATSVLTAAVVTAVAAPQVTVDASAPVNMTASSSSLQSAIDQLLAAEQAAAAHDSALPFATPGNMALLPSALQNLEFQELMLAMHGLYPSDPFLNLPGEVSQDGADTRAFTELPTTGNFYWITDVISPGASYVVTGTFNDAHRLQFLVDHISNTGSSQIGFAQSGEGLVVNPDGTYTVDIGPTKPSGAVNYLNDEGANFLLVKSFMGAEGPSTVHMECVADCPAAVPGVTSTGISTSEISSVLNTLAQNTPLNNGESTYIGISGGIEEPANTMSTVAQQNIVGESLANFSSNGNWDLQPDQALIVRIPGTVNDVNLLNAWGQLLPFPTTEMSFFGTQPTTPFQPLQDSDGYTYYVVSATNPGVANWLDTGGLQNGEVDVDLGAGVTAGEAIQTQVVPVADVSKYLPADTPTVSPAEFAATMASRVLSYDHAQDIVRTSDNSNWVTEELWLRDVQTAMGTQQFDAAFGQQPTSPMWLRLTPALSPDWLAVTKDMLTNPSASLTALEDNLSVAEKDISLPVTLAQTLLQQDFTQTAQAVPSDLSSGQLMQALQALESGGQQLGSILNGALFDPSTSITAGLLNARDGLATAVMAATNGGFPPHAGLLATLEWELMPELTQLNSSTTPTELSSLLDTAVSDLNSLL